MEMMSQRRMPVKKTSIVLVVLLACSQALSPFSPRPAALKTSADAINVAKKMLELSETKNVLENENTLLKKELDSANDKVAEAQCIADVKGQEAARVEKVNSDLLTEIALLNNQVIRLEGVSASLGNIVKKRDEDITVLRETNAVLENERSSVKALAKNLWKVVRGGVSKRVTGIKRRLFSGGQAAD